MSDPQPRERPADPVVDPEAPATAGLSQAPAGGGASAPSGPDAPSVDAASTAPGPPRPLVERVGMAAIAALMAILFAGVSAMSFASGEPFLGVMAAIGALMTTWVGVRTLVRG